MIRKGQVKEVVKDVVAQANFVAQIFGVAA